MKFDIELDDEELERLDSGNNIILLFPNGIRIIIRKDICD